MCVTQEQTDLLAEVDRLLSEACPSGVPARVSVALATGNCRLIDDEEVANN